MLDGVAPERVARALRPRFGVARLRRCFAAKEQVAAVSRLLSLRALMLALNLVTGILVAASLGPDGRGDLAATLIGMQFAGALGLFGLPTACIYHSKLDPAHRESYFGCAALLLMATASASAATAWLVIPSCLSGYDWTVVILAQWVLLVLPFSVLLPLFGAVLEAEGRFGLSGAVLAVQPLGCTVLLLVLLGSNALTPGSATFAYAAPIVLSCGVAAWLAVRLTRPVLRCAAPFRPRLLRYGRQRYGFEVLASLTTYLDQIVVVSFLPAAAAGIYAVALSLSRTLGVLQDAVCSVLFPHLAGRPLAEVVEALGRPLRLSSALAAAVAGILALVGPKLIALMFGHAFDGAVAPFRLLLAAVVVVGAARLLGHAFTATGRPGPTAVIEAVGVGSTLLAMPLLLPALGAAGAAAAVLVGAVARLVCTLASLKLVLRAPVPRLVVGRDDLRWLMTR